jgi:hypothetical protein
MVAVGNEQRRSLGEGATFSRMSTRAASAEVAGLALTMLSTGVIQDPTIGLPTSPSSCCITS